MEKKEGYRHGDVLIIKTSNIPKDAKKLNRLVLAEGEVTGHAHVVEGEASLYEKGGVLYLKVNGKKSARLKHEEHKTIELPEGNYKVKIQREYEPEGWRKVVD